MAEGTMMVLRVRNAFTALCAVVVMGLGSTAWAEPQWCGNYKKGRGGPSLKELQERDDADGAVTNLVAATCNPTDELKDKQAEVSAVRDRWSQKLEMNDADWGDAVAYAGLSQ